MWLTERRWASHRSGFFYEDTPSLPEIERVDRAAIDRMVLDAAGVRSVVLCNSMIYGNTPDVPAQSVQVRALAQQAKPSGIARYIGRGLNRWSNVHISDVASLYSIAITRAPAGSFIYVENGEETLGEIVRTIAKRLDLGAAQPWPAELAVEAWGKEKATFLLGSNSRVRGKRATELGWRPNSLLKNPSVWRRFDDSLYHLESVETTMMWGRFTDQGGHCRPVLELHTGHDGVQPCDRCQDRQTDSQQNHH